VNVWQYLDRRGERLKDTTQRILPHDFRGWVALGLFVQSSSLFGLMCAVKDLMDNQGFMTLASAVVVTGWIGGVAAFAYSAGKREGEQTAMMNKALDLVSSSTGSDTTSQDIEKAADAVADAAAVKADEIKGGAAVSLARVPPRPSNAPMLDDVGIDLGGGSRGQLRQRWKQLAAPPAEGK
jgi:hypothetical protein